MFIKSIYDIFLVNQYDEKGILVKDGVSGQILPLHEWRKKQKITGKDSMAVTKPVNVPNIPQSITHPPPVRDSLLSSDVKDKISRLYINSYQRDSFESNMKMWATEVISPAIINVQSGQELSLKGKKMSIFNISFPYENDNQYHAVLGVNENQTEGIILFEKAPGEDYDDYRYSIINEDTFTNFIQRIDFVKELENGETVPLEKPDTLLIKSNRFLLKNNHFVKVEP